MFSLPTAIGLTLDMIGVSIIIYGELKSPAAILKQSSSTFENVNWFRRFPLWLAKKVGSKDSQDTQDYVSESFPIKFWGFVLLLLGFASQIVGTFS